MHKNVMISDIENCAFCPYTVNKLRSINLLFSCMRRIERKTVHLGAGKTQYAVLDTSLH